MSAYVEHSFQRGFILDEQRIRKIKDSLESRLSKRVNPLSPTYKVYRGDTYSYTTQQIDDVIREDNEDWKRITRLDVVVAEDKDKLNLMLTFAKKGVDLNIVGDDRDEVFLLFSDLRDYIENEVTVARRFITKDTWLGVFPLAALMILILIFWAVFNTLSIHPEKYRAVINSTDISKKLNFLVEQKALPFNPRWFFVAFLGLLAFMILSFSGVSEKVAKYFFPSNEFIFGKQKQAFEHRQHVRSNIFWVGIIGLIVSVLAGFLVWYSTRGS